jgi:hypothetical protein
MFLEGLNQSMPGHINKQRGLLQWLTGDDLEAHCIQHMKYRRNQSFVKVTLNVSCKLQYMQLADSILTCKMLPILSHDSSI